MKWHNALNHKLPNDQQEVLISVDGIIYVAVFASAEKIFNVVRLKNLQFKPSEKTIYWTEYTRPE